MDRNLAGEPLLDLQRLGRPVIPKAVLVAALRPPT